MLLLLPPISKYSPTVLVSKDSNKSLLGFAKKITVVGKVESSVIEELTKKIPVLGALIGTCEDGYEYIDIDRFNFDGFPYDIIKTNERDNSDANKSSLSNEDIEYLLILDDEDDMLWFYTRSDVHGGFTGGTLFVRYK